MTNPTTTGHRPTKADFDADAHLYNTDDAPPAPRRHTEIQDCGERYCYSTCLHCKPQSHWPNRHTLCPECTAPAIQGCTDRRGFYGPLKRERR